MRSSLYSPTSLSIQGVFVLLILCLAFLPAISSAQEAEEIVPFDAESVVDDSAGVPEAPMVTSSMFTSELSWYGTVEGGFEWELPEDVTAVAFGIATESGVEPMTVSNPPVASLALDPEKVEDGVNYVSVQFKNAFGWGEVTERELRIDRQAPEAFEVEVKSDESSTPVLSFKTEDALSGVAFYGVRVDDGRPMEVSVKEAQSGYSLPDLDGGPHMIEVSAYDRAGNIATSYSEVVLEEGRRASGVSLHDGILTDFDGYKGIVFLMLLGMVGALLLQNVMDRKNTARKEEKLRKEARDIQKQTERIFTALRNEIFEQITTLSSKKKLTKKEEGVINELNHALKISETLIEKEIKDVRKKLK